MLHLDQPLQLLHRGVLRLLGLQSLQRRKQAVLHYEALAPAGHGGKQRRVAAASGGGDAGGGGGLPTRCGAPVQPVGLCPVVGEGSLHG